jgi:hypothetical protein
MVRSEIDKLILFGIRKNCLIRERSPLLYLFMDEAIKVVLTIRHTTVTNYIQRSMQYSS